MSELNVPLLRKAVEWVQVESELPEKERRWEQGWWRTMLLSPQGERCGTAYCLAGFVCEVDDAWTWHNDMADELRWGLWGRLRKMSAYGQGADGDLVSANVYATRSLGLTNNEAAALFSERNTAQDILKITRVACEARGLSLGL